MLRAKLTYLLFAMALIIALSFSIGIVCAEESTFFAIEKGANYVGGAGWYAGYVVSESGDFEMHISASGDEKAFPMEKVQIIVAESKAAFDGGVKSIAIDGVKIEKLTEGRPDYYKTPGGPFDESDYYGYNDEYVIKSELNFKEHHYPDGWYKLPVTIEFAAGANDKSKVAILCYGFDANGDPVETPFNQGTVFVLPEYVTPILGVAACFAGYGVFKIRAKTK